MMKNGTWKTIALMALAGLGSFFYSQSVYGERLAKMEVRIENLQIMVEEIKDKLNNIT